MMPVSGLDWRFAPQEGIVCFPAFGDILDDTDNPDRMAPGILFDRAMECITFGRSVSGIDLKLKIIFLPRGQQVNEYLVNPFPLRDAGFDVRYREVSCYGGIPENAKRVCRPPDPVGGNMIFPLPAWPILCAITSRSSFTRNPFALCKQIELREVPVWQQ